MLLGSLNWLFPVLVLGSLVQLMVFIRSVVFSWSPGDEYQPSFYRLTHGNTSACLATGFSRFHQLQNLTLFNQSTEAARISQDSLFNQVAFMDPEAEGEGETRCPEGAHRCFVAATSISWILSITRVDVCFRWRRSSLRRRSAARSVPLCRLQLCGRCRARTAKLTSVVVHRPAGEPGVSDGHRTSCAPPEDTDLQYPDDAASVCPCVWVDQELTRTQRVVHVLGVSSWKCSAVSCRTSAWAGPRVWRSRLKPDVWNSLSYCWCQYFSWDCKIWALFSKNVMK